MPCRIRPRAISQDSSSVDALAEPAAGAGCGATSIFAWPGDGDSAPSVSAAPNNPTTINSGANDDFLAITKPDTPCAQRALFSRGRNRAFGPFRQFKKPGCIARAPRRPALPRALWKRGEELSSQAELLI